MGAVGVIRYFWRHFYRPKKLAKNSEKNSDKTKETKWHKFQVSWIYVIFSIFPTQKTNLGNTRRLMERRGVILYLWRGL